MGRAEEELLQLHPAIFRRFGAAIQRGEIDALVVIEVLVGRGRHAVVSQAADKAGGYLEIGGSPEIYDFAIDPRVRQPCGGAVATRFVPVGLREFLRNTVIDPHHGTSSRRTQARQPYTGGKRRGTGGGGHDCARFGGGIDHAIRRGVTPRVVRSIRHRLTIELPRVRRGIVGGLSRLGP